MSDQRGHSALIFLVFVITICVIGLAGYLVWAHNEGNGNSNFTKAHYNDGLAYPDVPSDYVPAVQPEPEKSQYHADTYIYSSNKTIAQLNAEASAMCKNAHFQIEESGSEDSGTLYGTPVTSYDTQCSDDNNTWLISVSSSDNVHPEDWYKGLSDSEKSKVNARKTIIEIENTGPPIHTCPANGCN